MSLNISQDAEFFGDGTPCCVAWKIPSLTCSLLNSPLIQACVKITFDHCTWNLEYWNGVGEKAQLRSESAWIVNYTSMFFKGVPATDCDIPTNIHYVACVLILAGWQADYMVACECRKTIGGWLICQCDLEIYVVAVARKGDLTSAPVANVRILQGSCAFLL